MNYSKYLGSVLIVIGTTIGAGMLALPLVSAPVGCFFCHKYIDYYMGAHDHNRPAGFRGKLIPRCFDL